MRPECEDAVEIALGRPLRRGEADKIDKSINRNMRQLAQKDPEAWQALSPTERLQQGAKAAVDEMVAAVKEKQRLTQLQIQAHDKIENQLNAAFDRLPENAKPGSLLRAFSNLIAFDTTNRGRGLPSVESAVNAIKAESMGNLMNVWKNIKGFMGLFEDKRASQNLIREMFGEDSGDPTAKRAVEDWFKTTDELHERTNKAGASIGKLDNHDWHLPQSWSQARIAQAGKTVSESLQKWIDKMLPRLDRKRYLNEDGTRMTDQQITDKVLTPAFDTQLTDGRNKRSPGSTSETAAGDMSGHRILFFKDADSYMAAQGDFGEKNLWRAMQDHINRMAREIALRESFGPQHGETFKYFNDRIALDEIRQHGDEGLVRRKESQNQALYDFVSGRHQIVDQRVADWGQAFRNWEVTTKLGGVAITALSDEAAMAATAFANHVPWTQVLGREVTFATDSVARRAAANAGLGISTILGGLNRLGTEDFNMHAGMGIAGKAREFGSKFASATMKYSGAEPMWDLRRRALGSVLMQSMASLTRQFEHFADINEADHGILARKGFSETDWQVMKLAKPEDWGSIHGVLTPKSIREIPDSQLKALGDPDALRRSASTMLLGHVLEEVSMGVMEQGARQRAGISKLGQSGGTAGAIGGELARSAMLFKGFALSMMTKHWARANSLPLGSRAMYYATLGTIGSITGAAALQLQAMARGEDPPNIVEPKFWGKAILKGGGLGYFGDFIGEATNSNDNTIASAVGGPMVTESQNLWNLTGAAAIKKSQGERTDEIPNLIRFARGNNPLNFWYTKAAWDHLLWNNMQEAASPGYLDRVQAKAQASRGTSWFWDPHESTPARAPDFSKAIQPERGAQQLDTIKNVAQSALGEQ